MMDEPFLQIRLQGGRFKDAELPFFMLKDLAPLQDMIVDIAKLRYKEKEDRQRSSFDFSRTYLKLVGLQDGSTVAVINIGTTKTILDGAPVPKQEYFDAARNEVIEVMQMAERGAEHLNGKIPIQYMTYFNRIGRSLQDNEVVEVATGQRMARLTLQSREVLARHSGGKIIRDKTFRGVIPAVSIDKMKFRLKPIHGRAIDCPFLDRHSDTILEALTSYKNAKNGDTAIRVRVQATGTYDKQDHLQIVDPVRSVELLDQFDVGARLDEFRSLRDGWLEDGADAPDHAGLDWLSAIFERYYPDDLKLPRTYPTADGGISLEWSFGIREIDIEVNLKTHVGEWYVFNKNTEQGEEEKTLELDKPADWEWVSEQLQSLTEQSEYG